MSGTERVEKLSSEIEAWCWGHVDQRPVQLEREMARDLDELQALKSDRLATLARAMIEKFGARAQLDQLQEECAELIAAVSHHRRGRPMGIVELVGELVDVEIMVAQIRNVVPRELYNEIMVEKLDRLQRRVEGK